MTDRRDQDPAELIEFPDEPGPSAEYEGLNALRLASLALLSRESREQPLEVRDELLALGFGSQVIERPLSPQDRPLRLQIEGVREYLGDLQGEAFAAARERAWTDLNHAEPRPSAALAYLLLGLGSEHERESAVAALAIFQVLGLPDTDPSDWDELRWLYRHLGPRGFDELYELGNPPFGWPFRYLWTPWWGDDAEVAEEDDQPVAPVQWQGEAWRSWFTRLSQLPLDYLRLGALLMVIARLRLAARSPDPITREFASAARLSFGVAAAGPGIPPTGPMSNPPSNGVTLSTMVHGTRGWKGTWWYPGGDFHQYVKDHLRANLYDEGRPYSWSGAYSDRQREQAASRFVGWLDGDQAQTVFGHSFGGEVLSRASANTTVDELVLMSAPVTPHVRAAVGRVRHVVDVRLRFDLVLAFTGHPQRLADSRVTPVLLRGWFWSHSASRNPRVWAAQDVISRAGL